MGNEIKKPEPQTEEEKQFLQLAESGKVRPEFAEAIVKGMQSTHEAVENVIAATQETEKKPETHEEYLNTALGVLNLPNSYGQPLEQRLELLKNKGFNILKINGWENMMALIATPNKPNYYYIFAGGKGARHGRLRWFYDLVDANGNYANPITGDAKLNNTLSLPEVGDIDERRIRKDLEGNHVTGDLVSILTKKKGVAEIGEILKS